MSKHKQKIISLFSLFALFINMFAPFLMFPPTALAGKKCTGDWDYDGREFCEGVYWCRGLEDSSGCKDQQCSLRPDDKCLTKEQKEEIKEISCSPPKCTGAASCFNAGYKSEGDRKCCDPGGSGKWMDISSCGGAAAAEPVTPTAKIKEPELPQNPDIRAETNPEPIRQPIVSETCSPGQKTCLSKAKYKYCKATGDGWLETYCPSGKICQDNNCVDRKTTSIIQPTILSKPPIPLTSPDRLPGQKEEMEKAERGPYCSTQKLVSCNYGCEPTFDGGRCKPKPEESPAEPEKPERKGFWQSFKEKWEQALSPGGVVLKKSYCEGNTLITKGAYSPTVSRKTERKECEWGCDQETKSCKKATPEQAMVLRYDILQIKLDRAEAQGIDVSTSEGYREAINIPLHGDYLSNPVKEAFNETELPPKVKDALVEAKYDQYLEKCGETAKYSGETYSCNKDKLEKKARTEVERVLSIGALNYDQSDNLAQREDIWTNYAANICSSLSSIGTEKCTEEEIKIAKDSPFTKFQTWTWTKLVAGAKPLGKQLGAQQTNWFQYNEVVEKVLKPCGLKGWEQELTSEQKTCVTAYSVATKAHIDNLQNERWKDAALTAVDVGLGFTGAVGATKLLTAAPKIVQAAGMIGADVVTAGITTIPWAQLYTAEEKETASLLTTMAEKASADEKEYWQNLARQAQENYEVTYKQEKISGFASGFIFALGGNGLMGFQSKFKGGYFWDGIAPNVAHLAGDAALAADIPPVQAKEVIETFADDVIDAVRAKPSLETPSVISDGLPNGKIVTDTLDTIASVSKVKSLAIGDEIIIRPNDTLVSGNYKRFALETGDEIIIGNKTFIVGKDRIKITVDDEAPPIKIKKTDGSNQQIKLNSNVAYEPAPTNIFTRISDTTTEAWDNLTSRFKKPQEVEIAETAPVSKPKTGFLEGLQREGEPFGPGGWFDFEWKGPRDPDTGKFQWPWEKITLDKPLYISEPADVLQSSGLFDVPGVVQHESVVTDVTLRYQNTERFPNLPFSGWKEGNGEVLETVLGRTLIPKITGGDQLEKAVLTFSLPSYGRADAIPMVFEAADGTKFGVLYRKGIGAARWTRQKDFPLEVFTKGDLSRVGFTHWNNFDMDAQRSLQWHDNGMRVRLPVTAFDLESVATTKGILTIDELVKEGIIDTNPGFGNPIVAVWARRNPFTFDDAFVILNYDSWNTTTTATSLLKAQVPFLQLENGKQAKRIVRLIENGSGEKEWFTWLSETAGEQAARAADNGFVQRNFHSQNLTLAIESGDLADDYITFKPISSDSRENELAEYADQALNFLSPILKLKEAFNLAYGRPVNEGVDQIIQNFAKSITNNSPNGSLLLESIINPNIRFESRTSGSPTGLIFTPLGKFGRHSDLVKETIDHQLNTPKAFRLFEKIYNLFNKKQGLRIVKTVYAKGEETGGRVIPTSIYRPVASQLLFKEQLEKLPENERTTEKVVEIMGEISRVVGNLPSKGQLIINKENNVFVGITGTEGKITGILPKGTYKVNVKAIDKVQVIQPTELKIGLNQKPYLEIGLRKGEGVIRTDNWLVKTRQKLSSLIRSAKAQEATANTSNNRVDIQLYHDKNGNGIYDADEGDSPWAGVEVELAPTSEMVGFEFNEGWNLINFPIYPESIKTAAEATQDVALDGGYITTIVYWDGNRWIEYSQRAQHQYGQDFELKPGVAYFIRASVAMTWTVAGKKVDKPIPIDLQKGWNAIGIPYSNSPYTAMKLVNELAADSVSKWDSGLWSVYVKDYGFDFDIKKEDGIMIRVNKDLRFEPEQ